MRCPSARMPPAVPGRRRDRTWQSSACPDPACWRRPAMPAYPAPVRCRPADPPDRTGVRPGLGQPDGMPGTSGRTSSRVRQRPRREPQRRPQRSPPAGSRCVGSQASEARGPWRPSRIGRAKAPGPAASSRRLRCRVPAGPAGAMRQAHEAAPPRTSGATGAARSSRMRSDVSRRTRALRRQRDRRTA